MPTSEYDSLCADLHWFAPRGVCQARAPSENCEGGVEGQGDKRGMLIEIETTQVYAELTPKMIKDSSRPEVLGIPAAVVVIDNCQSLPPSLH